jgi:hypothetical protein
MRTVYYLFIILNVNKITQQHTFGLKGDYEGITLVNDLLYVLRSDGVLFEIKNYQIEKN